MVEVPITILRSSCNGRRTSDRSPASSRYQLGKGAAVILKVGIQGRYDEASSCGIAGMGVAAINALAIRSCANLRRHPAHGKRPRRRPTTRYPDRQPLRCAPQQLCPPPDGGVFPPWLKDARGVRRVAFKDLLSIFAHGGRGHPGHHRPHPFPRRHAARSYASFLSGMTHVISTALAPAERIAPLTRCAGARSIMQQQLSAPRLCLHRPLLSWRNAVEG